MTKTLTNKNFWELFEEAKQNGEIVSQSNKLESLWEYPKYLGQGYSRWFQIQPGLNISIHDYSFQEPITVKAPESEICVRISFSVSGNFRCDCAGYVIPGQHTLFGSGIEPKETIEFPAQQQLVRVDISMTPQLLGMLVTGETEPLPSALQPMVKGSDRHKLFGITTPTMQRTLQQTWHCPYQGLTKRLHLESRVMELIALQLDQLLESDRQPGSSPSLQMSDIDRIYQARDILVQNLDRPPSLLEISRQVGLNRRKLNEVFQQVFGTTLFSYLRDRRLLEAQRLLKEQDMRVGEVAAAVGYANQGCFTLAFRQKFGINPKSYQLRGGKREI